MTWYDGFFVNKKEKTPPAPPEPDPPSGDLWDLVLDMNWQRVIEHAKEHPRDAEWQDGHWHETPLYLACQHSPPVEAIQAIIRAYPDAVMIPSRANHDLPLHIACRYQLAEEVLEELVRSFPATTVKQTRWGRTPVMALWEFRPKGPLDETFWNKVIVLLTAVARFREDPKFGSQSSQTTPTTRFQQNCIVDDIDKETSTFNNEPSILHAAVALGSLSCPVEVLNYVLERFPEQVFQCDRWGRLPLHIIVGPTSWSHTRRRKYKPRGQKFISSLLGGYPGAAKQTIFDDHGRYPIHTALANRHTWAGGVQDLFHAAPEIVTTPDPYTKLYPFQLAAIPVRETEVDLDTIYCLLRSRPEVMKLFDVGKRGHQTETMKGSENKRVDKYSSFVFQSLLGTIAAIFIGGVVGAVFTE